MLSDKCRHVEHELLFFLSIASLEKGFPIQWSTHGAPRALEDAQGIAKFILSAGPLAPCLATPRLWNPDTSSAPHSHWTTANEQRLPWNRALFSGESHRPLTPILLKSIAIHLPFLSRYSGKSMPSWQKVPCTPPICIMIRLPFVSRYFFRSIRVRGRWNTPNLGQIGADFPEKRGDSLEPCWAAHCPKS